MVSSIEGVGGEVIQFFLCLGVILVGCLLWLSTRVRNAEEPFFRTVYVLERRVRDTEPLSNNAQIMDQPTNESLHSVTELNTDQTAVVAHPIVVSNEDVDGVSNSEVRRESQNCVDDAKSNTEADTCESPDGSHSSNNVVKLESNSSKIEGKVTDESESKNIKVRLKYTNDDSREVNGILQEKLVDFKRRNFPEEMSANKLIRLIFNGRMLRDDNTSLQNYGLFDDCVVHCLIINERPSQPANMDQQEQQQSYAMNNGGQPPAPEWHLNKMFWFFIVTFFIRFMVLSISVRYAVHIYVNIVSYRLDCSLLMLHVRHFIRSICSFQRDRMKSSKRILANNTQPYQLLRDPLIVLFLLLIFPVFVLENRMC